ncbi:hypothetical protein G7046_g6918 [Stylonectria norvegica]|nr:hypothetical protein G7046_g6918 [Stylonectria norvegica]
MASCPPWGEAPQAGFVVRTRAPNNNAQRRPQQRHRGPAKTKHKSNNAEGLTRHLEQLSATSAPLLVPYAISKWSAGEFSGEDKSQTGTGSSDGGWVGGQQATSRVSRGKMAGFEGTGATETGQAKLK